MTYSEKIGEYLIKNKLTISTAESCTGGLLSSALTDISGSSAYIKLNLVTYANEAKIKMLNVSPRTLGTHGAVSEECAYEMAKGLHNLTKTDICISTTGIAGPTGGTIEKPVGLMYSCIYTKDFHKIYKIIINPNLTRKEIKQEFVYQVLKNISNFLYQ